MKNLKPLIFLFIIFSNLFVSAENKTDSLYKLLSKRIHDTIKIDVYNELCWPVYSFSNIDSSIKYGERAIVLSAKIQDTMRLIIAYRRIGIAYINRADHQKALFYQQKSYDLAKIVNFKKGMASALNNLSVIYLNISDFKKAIDYSIQSQKIQEELKDSSNLFNSYYNTGLLFKNIEDYNSAKQYYMKAYKIARLQNMREKQAFAMAGLGTILKTEKNFNSALHYYLKAEEWFKSENHLQGLSEIYVNIGSLYSDWNSDNRNLKKALDYYSKALAVNKIYDNQLTEANILGNVARLYEKLGKPDSTIYYATKAIDLAKKVGDNAEIVFTSRLLSDAYLKKENYKLSIKYLNLHVIMKDSVYNYEKQKDIEQKQMKYEFEKKTIADSLLVVEEKKITYEKLKQEKTIRYGLFLFMALLITFSFIMFNRFKIIKKKNGIIREQKEIVEEKQREIIDSINYAERIQRSFLATEDLLTTNLSLASSNLADINYFVFFQPKAVVSGDFYWASKLSNGNFALATADSTGHGVPGAIMSILNISSLEKAVEQGLCEPSEILNHTRKTIIERLKKDGSKEGGKDGMDCSLICFDFSNNRFNYSAANNPIWVIRNNHLIELSADKMPVGKHDKDQTSFNQHEFQLNQGDLIYTLTDGMPDQFGGPKGKKFMYKRLKEVLVSISQLPMQEQKEKLNETLYNWKGHLEQVDDVCVIGIKI